VIPPDYEPPECAAISCPPASYPASAGHGSCPRDCVPVAVECTGDSDCAQRIGQNSRCIDTSFCLEEVSLGRMGRQPAVRGECRADGSCETGTCTRARRCTQPVYETTSTEDAEEDDDCSAGGTSALAASALALALVAIRRARRRAA
jgi:hypothetical protein